jgi:beta-lactamase regulating signal transducer with metallopeptidase domain/predicted  nucleic acid-binding Zn-ribbon protein
MDALLLLKASLLLSATLLAARLLRRAPASSRHRLWTFAFAAVLALPLLAVALPSVYVPIPLWRGVAASPSIDVPVTRRGEPAAVAQRSGSGVTQPTSPHSGGQQRRDASGVSDPERAPSTAFASVPTLRGLLLTAWVGGALTAVGVLLLSLTRVRRLAGTADDLNDESWTTAARALGTRLGLRRPARLLISPAVGTPMAGGFWRPAIFLPSSAREWSTEQRDVVLAHELAHLAGHDSLRHVAARLAVAFYWFHPLAWMAARQAVAAREQACDEAVLALGTRPSDYARVLLDLAASLHPSRAALGALPMVERSHLETRLMAILNNDSRVVARRGALIPAVAVAVCTLAVAAAQPGVRASAAGAASTAVAADPASAAATSLSSVASAFRRNLVSAAPEPGQPRGIADSACAPEGARWASFMGRTDTRVIDGRTVVVERVGTNGSDRIIQESFGDLRVCMVAERVGPTATNEKPSQWGGRAERVVLEARRGDRTQRLEIGPNGNAPRVSWQIDGKDRGFDAAAQRWRDQILAAADTVWEMTLLQGEVSNLHGEISNIRGEESNLRGEISNLYGEESNLRGEISNVRGQESNLRGEISNIRGHVSSLQGAISSEQGSISNLRAGGYRSDDTTAVRDAVKRHEDEITRIEREIRDYGADAKVAAVEREIARLNAAKQVDALEAQIRKFDLNRKVADVERQIAVLDINGKIAGLQKKIDALDADRRVRELERRREDELKRLEAAIAAIR